MRRKRKIRVMHYSICRNRSRKTRIDARRVSLLRLRIRQSVGRISISIKSAIKRSHSGVNELLATQGTLSSRVIPRKCPDETRNQQIR
jgi:glutamate racemase